jgi:hypothetical protein
MANCNEIFHTYSGSIRLPDEKRIELIGVREELRGRMLTGYQIVSKGYEHRHELYFQSQGSFVMDTIIVPANDDYDLDDGVYFVGTLAPNQRPSPVEFHKWVQQSLDRGHDDIEEIVDKTTCVRVKYKSGFHIDIPIYYAEHFDCPDLAHKEKGWILSNPVEFIAWFEEKIQSGFEKRYLYNTARYAGDFDRWSSNIRKQDHQLRRIVRYLKAWGDLRREEMPCGLIMTILVANNYYPHERDDIALKETLVNIQAELQVNFRCERPTTPIGEDLFDGYKNRDAFMRYLARFIDDGKKALAEPNPKKACENWQNSLGGRFPCHLAKDESTQHAAPGLVAGVGAANPWLNAK